MACKVLMRTIVAIAVIIAILSLISNHYAIALVIFASRFFAVMIPVLAVAGLLKWIFFSDKCSKCAQHSKD